MAKTDNVQPRGQTLDANATAADLRPGDEFEYLVLNSGRAGNYRQRGRMTERPGFFERDGEIVEIKNPACPVAIVRRGS
jgi:hypothetical protein